MDSRKIQDFTVIPLRFSNETSSNHDLFIKEHKVRNYSDKKPAGRTLFALNIPPYATQGTLKNVFSAAGPVQSVFLQDTVAENQSDPIKSTNGFKVAYIVFKKREGLLQSLKLKQLNELNSTGNSVLVGLQKWITGYNLSIYHHKKLNEEVNEFISNKDKLEEQQKESEKQDDDGWTVVKKKGRNPGISRKESVANKIIHKNQMKSRKKELKNFYTFQLKEEKMKNIINLRKNFQDSREKVNMMKKMRNFKPF